MDTQKTLLDELLKAETFAKAKMCDGCKRESEMSVDDYVDVGRRADDEVTIPLSVDGNFIVL